MHKILVHLAIVGLLLCPYDCAAREAAARLTGDNQAAAACCQKCRERQQQSPTPRPSEDGKSCICEGAMFDAAAAGPVVPPLDATLWAVIVDPVTMPELTSPDWIALHTGPPPLLGGRQVRIAVQSFLL
jgi:hypothetical protein